MMHVRLLSLLLFFAGLATAAVGDDELQFGFAKTDVTPTVPLRLSGYSSRTEPFEGIDDPLLVRAMAIRYGDEGDLAILVSVDTIGFPGTLTKSILERLTEQYGLTRERFALCCTHSHTSPVVGTLRDMFDVPMTDEQKQNTTAYVKRLEDQVAAAVGAAIDDLQPGRMFAGEGEATFAVNRRLLEDGTWAGFGINPDGPVDHRLPFLKITAADGETVRGIVFNYACHCTTFGGEYNRVNGDWAGYAAKYLEAAHDGATALCTIGAGADANPERDPERAFDLAQAQGKQVSDEIDSLLDGPLTEITARPTASFGYAGLPIDRPTKQQLEDNLESASRQVRQHAEFMLDTLARMGRLPETYPMPIQVWRFGEQFTMVFLGGEVCVDYGLRIKEELLDLEDTASAGDASSEKESAIGGLSRGTSDDSQPSTLNPHLTPWVIAYANDVFGYVASERMRDEGGYEVDYSMIYYMLPGRWSSGTEEVILRRVHEMYENTGKVGPLSPDDALQTFTLTDGYELELVAAEPLVRDPINAAYDEQGRLWVVEMGDYPRGNPDLPSVPADERSTPWEGPPGGTIKVLTDDDGDSRFDSATIFLTGLSFPTGVYPWQDGVLISAAPDLLFARDTDGDGRADEQTPLYTGFDEDNPQHRINGFTLGPDDWLYLAAGTNNGEITSIKTGETVDMSGRDLRIHPETGGIEAVSGSSQCGRTCDVFGNWFGNDNSDPLWHYVMEDRYQRRNPFVATPSPRVFLTDPPRAPPVYPTSRTLDRFNDLFALDRFTSACSPYIWRVESDDEQLTALICEPVHNLVSRVILEPQGVTFAGHRREDEQESEILSSTDNWFRPVRIIEEPDGSLLICDMYRMVIEHPEWIPEAWQAQLDLYAGHDQGRIYRLKQLADQPGDRLSGRVSSAADGPARAASDVDARLSDLHSQNQAGNLSTAQLLTFLADPHPGIVRAAVRIAEGQLPDDPALLTALLELAEHDDIRVRYQLALTLGQSADERIAQALLRIADRDPDNVWIRTAVLTSAVPHALPMLTLLLEDRERIDRHKELLEGLIATALGDDVERMAPQIARAIAGSLPGAEVEPWQQAALASFLDALERRGSSWEIVAESADEHATSLSAAIEPIFATSRAAAGTPDVPLSERTAALSLLGHQPAHQEADIALLTQLLSPQTATEIQTAAVGVLAGRLDDELPAILLDGWKQHSPTLRSTIVTTLLSREPWMEALMREIEASNVPPGDMDASARQRLITTWNGPVREAAARIYGGPDESDRAEVVATYADVLTLEGDARRGAEVFKKICSACHQHGGMGKDLGPRLANLQNKSTEALLTAILDPNRAAEQKYAAYVVITGDGRALSGLIKSETGGSLTLAEPNGTEHVILRIDIEEMQATGKSFMPEGLEKDLSPQAVADVIRFVQTAPSQ